MNLKGLLRYYLKIIKHSADYLITDLLHAPDRAAIISPIEFAWIKRFCPELWHERPPSSVGEHACAGVSVYLSEIFAIGNRS